jgi:hypothetical protein
MLEWAIEEEHTGPGNDRFTSAHNLAKTCRVASFAAAYGVAGAEGVDFSSQYPPLGAAYSKHVPTPTMRKAPRSAAARARLAVALIQFEFSGAFQNNFGSTIHAKCRSASGRTSRRTRRTAAASKRLAANRFVGPGARSGLNRPRRHAVSGCQ